MSWFCLIPSRQRRTPGTRQAPFSARPRLEELESRLVPYSVTGNAWPAPQLVTISFVPDGTVISGNGANAVTSNLHAKLNARFGSASAWQGVVLRAAQSWAQQANVNFAVVPDDGSALGSGLYQQGDPSKGDIRVGGHVFGNGHLATAYLPPPANNYSIAGDVLFNTGQTWSSGTTYDLFTVAAHEVGHALGLGHSGVVSSVMYSAYNGTKSALGSDDVGGVRAVYGGARRADEFDAHASNGSFSTASDLTGAMGAGATLSVLADVTTTSDVDYYRLVAGESGTLQVSLQSTGLSLLAPALKVYNQNQALVASVTRAGTTGGVATATISVTAGSAYYFVADGADNSAFGTGAYALNLGLNTAAPTAASPSTQRANGETLSGGGGGAQGDLTGNVPAAVDVVESSLFITAGVSDSFDPDGCADHDHDHDHEHDHGDGDDHACACSECGPVPGLTTGGPHATSHAMARLAFGPAARGEGLGWISTLLAGPDNLFSSALVRSESAPLASGLGGNGEPGRGGGGDAFWADLGCLAEAYSAGEADAAQLRDLAQTVLGLDDGDYDLPW